MCPQGPREADALEPRVTHETRPDTRKNVEPMRNATTGGWPQQVASKVTDFPARNFQLFLLVRTLPHGDVFFVHVLLVFQKQNFPMLE